MDLFEKSFDPLSRPLINMQQKMGKIWNKECSKTSILKFIKVNLPPAYEPMYPKILQGVDILENALFKSSTVPGCEGWWSVMFVSFFNQQTNSTIPNRLTWMQCTVRRGSYEECAARRLERNHLFFSALNDGWLSFSKQCFVSIKSVELEDKILRRNVGLLHQPFQANQL